MPWQLIYYAITSAEIVFWSDFPKTNADMSLANRWSWCTFFRPRLQILEYSSKLLCIGESKVLYRISLLVTRCNESYRSVCDIVHFYIPRYAKGLKEIHRFNQIKLIYNSYLGLYIKSASRTSHKSGFCLEKIVL